MEKITVIEDNNIDVEGIICLDVILLRDYCDPFSNNLWLDMESPITKEEIDFCLDHNILIEPDDNDEPMTVYTRDQHAGKIAYFVKEGIRDPISIDIGIPSLSVPCWFIVDGNHRYAAAIIREEPKIKAAWSGDLDFLQSLDIVYDERKHKEVHQACIG
jgi:hypothetical protein